ncbi:hypothetical protein FNH05_28255, partial [Amycolatopsis rhizosphaerae]
MTQPGGTDGYARRLYEAEVYAKASAERAGKNAWVDRVEEPADIAGKYSVVSGELYEQKVTAEGGGYRDGLAPSDLYYHALPHETLILMVHDGVSPEDVDEQGM